jgi:hypothetical protein
MLTKIAFALALTLGAASAASAVTKHPIHHHNRAAVQPQAPAGYGTYGYHGPAPYVPYRFGNPNGGGTNFQSEGCGLNGCI